MICPECHHNNRKDAKFCKSCGTILEDICPSCGYAYESGNLFCDQCGCNLEIIQSPLSIDYSQPDSYTPKFLADKILNTRSTIEGERKIVTVLFADVANSTAIIEKLDPEEVHHVMNGCFKILIDRIHIYEGTINQFRGDGIMALFGAPIALENHAQHACYAALSIQKAMAEYENKVKHSSGLEFKLRLGINTGLVMVGSIGNNLRMDYTADGDTTYLAKRLESIARPGDVLVSENTYRLVKSYFKIEDLTPVKLKGMEHRQNAYLLIDSNKLKTRFEEAVAKGLVRFVGRKNSMAILRNTWNEAIKGQGQALGIMGEPGVGKSRLMLEFKNSLFEKDSHFLEGRCLPYGDSITYLPFIDILKSYFSIQEGHRDADIVNSIQNKFRHLGKDHPPFLLSAFHQLLSLKITDTTWQEIDPTQKKNHIFESLKWLLLTMSKEKPLITLIDDLQWIDKISEEFLNEFIDAIPQSPILLVLLYRPEYEHVWWNRSHYSKIGLGQLTKKSVVELTSAVLEDVTVEDKLEQYILRQCAGNPLFVEEFIYTLLENDYIRRKENRFVLIREPDSIKIPDTIRGIVATRIDKLDNLLKQIIQTASVIGHHFGYRILQTITGMGEELKSCLDKLRSLEFIYEKDIFPELEYTFRHALIQEVAYRSLLRKRRIDLHAKIGLAIEYIYESKLDEFYEILAHHFTLGEDYPNAIKYLKLSGEKAEEYFSHLAAFEFFKRALNISEKLPDESGADVEMLDIIRLMAPPIAIYGFPKGSLEVLDKGITIANKLADKTLLSRFRNTIRLLKITRGDPSSSIDDSEELFYQAKKNEDLEIMAHLSPLLCYAFVTSCKCEKVIDISQSVIGLIEKYERIQDSFNSGFILNSFLLGVCGFTMAMRGDFKKGEIVSKKGLEQAHKSKHKMTLAFNELQYAGVHILKGDGNTAMRHCENAINFSENIQWPTIQSQGWTLRGCAYYLIGELNTAHDFISKGLNIQLKSGIEAMTSMHYYMFTMVLYEMGDPGKALQCARNALKFSIKNKKNPEKRYEGLSKIWIGKILGDKGRTKYEEGEQSLLEGYEILNKLGVRPAIAQGHLHFGEFYRNFGEEARAEGHIAKAKSMFGEMRMDYWKNKCQKA